MALQRRFNFFEKDVVKDSLTHQPFDGLKDIAILCATSGRGYLWFGDKDGFIHRLDRNLKRTAFRAYERSVRLCKQVKQHDLLVTVGHESTEEDKIKVWNISKWESDAAPFCCRIIKATNSGSSESPVTCIEVLENLNYMFVGHVNGSIEMFKGDVTRERNNKRRVIHEGARPITNITAMTTERGITLFATTDSTIFSLIISNKEQIEKTPLDNQFGCNVNCAVLLDNQKSADSQPFIAACREAIYFYQWDARGRCYGVEGDKYLVHHYKTGYLVVVRPNSATLSSASTNPSYLSETRQPVSLVNQQLPESTVAPLLVPPRGPHQVTIFDYVNRFIAAEFQLPDVKCILSEWGNLFVLCSGGANSSTGENQLVNLLEKDIQSKLDLLFSKKSYNVAIDIARSQHFDDDQMANLFKRYADHLYKSKEYDAAIQEYMKTIGKLEPSYVIQKFLNTSRIHNLTAYLQALHKARLATGDHTTLLLNCYSKLRDEENLNRFIANAEEMKFDVETAIRVLRQSGMTSQARDLAKRFHHHDWYLRIVLEDEKQYELALQYMSALDFEDALPAIVTHGNVLMEHRPQKTAELLDKICSGSSNSVRMDVSHFMRIFVSNREGLMDFLERYIKNTLTTDLVAGVVDTLLELYLYSLHILSTPPEPTDPSILSLELVRKRSSVEVKTRTVEELETKIMELLQNTSMPYNAVKQLMLCYQRQFSAGYLYLCERLKEYDQILDFYLDAGDKDKILETCQRYGDEKKDLWLKALSFYGARQDCEEYLKKVVSVIDECDIIPPISVIQNLSKGNQIGCTLGAIKDYLIRRLEKSQMILREFESKIESYRKETDENRAVINNLSNKFVVFQIQKCNVCNQSLDFPSVHFLCGHSFHELCFKNYAHSEEECPSCAIKNKEIKAEIDRYAAAATNKTAMGNAAPTSRGLSLAASWELAFEGLGRTFSLKPEPSSGISTGPVGQNSALLMKTGDSTPPQLAFVGNKPGSSTSRNEPPLPLVMQGTRVQTSADVHRSGGAVGMNMPPQLTSAVASAGQTISEATAAASNFATGIINQMKVLRQQKPSASSSGLSGSRGSLNDAASSNPFTGPPTRAGPLHISPSDTQLVTAARGVKSQPGSTTSRPPSQAVEKNAQPTNVGKSQQAASSYNSHLSASVPIDRVEVVEGSSSRGTPGNPFLTNADQSLGNPFEEPSSSAPGNPFDEEMETEYPEEKNPFQV